MITEFVEKIIVGIVTAIIVGLLTFLWTRKHKLYNWTRIAKSSSFSELFSEIEKHSKQYDELKIIANSTNALLPAFQDSNVKVGSCQIILRCPKEDESELASFLKTVKQDWRDLEKKGRISKLSIHCVDNLLLDWQAIFDDKFMMLGLNSPHNENWKKYKMVATFLVSKTSKSSKEMIEKYRSRFDMVFETSQEL